MATGLVRLSAKVHVGTGPYRVAANSSEASQGDVPELGWAALARHVSG